MFRSFSPRPGDVGAVGVESVLRVGESRTSQKGPHVAVSASFAKIVWTGDQGPISRDLGHG